MQQRPPPYGYYPNQQSQPYGYPPSYQQQQPYGYYPQQPQQYGYPSAQQQQQQPPYGYYQQPPQPPPSSTSKPNIQPPPSMSPSQMMAAPPPPPPQPMMAAAPMMGQPMWSRPGQEGLNPCNCCKFCCGGTCTLKYGCIFIAVYLIVIAHWSFVNAFQNTTPAWIEGGTTKYEGEAQGIILRVRLTKWFKPVTLVDAFVINLASGLILLAGSLFHIRLCCLGFVILQGFALFWTLIYAGLATKSVNYPFFNLPLDSYGVVVGGLFYPGSGAGGSYGSNYRHYNRQFDSSALEDVYYEGGNGKTLVLAVVWISALIGIALHIWFLLCGLGLAQQIERGEYGQSGFTRDRRATMLSVPQAQFYDPDAEDAGSPKSGEASATDI